MGDDAVNSTAVQFNRDAILKELNDKGYCVIPDVLTSDECDVYIGKYRDWLATFGEDEAPFQRHSIIQSYRVGHLEPTWEVRLKAKSVFQTIWQTDKLLSSVDAVAIAEPPEKESQAFDTPNTNWFHLDQSAIRVGLHGYQGAVYLEETSETDYCFRVLVGSHKQYDSFYDRDEAVARKSIKLDYYKLNNNDVAWYQQHDCYPSKVPVPKGGMVVWDSRLVHDNCRPEEGRPNKDRWRFVVFVCMTPARWARKKDLQLKREAYKKLLMTSHWPSQGITFFEERPLHIEEGHRIKKLPGVARSHEAKLLAGVEEYDFEDGRPNGPDWEPQWREQ
ncbi:uncharacterized protein LOC112556286 isoform X2 [Pomacea canaliculata]|uniref:uncharacterized protein LOC112556286 isoform X2 n=1 Tax=Pomacea canaliculata TaxID=400727 RepID=UPI000D739074|nr:uncharacterized protein LOC112556286 isoform X2 [Pomacea canaliculata]